MKATKENVTARLIKNGNNVEESRKMVAEHFDFAYNHTNEKTVNHVARMIIVYA